MKTVFKSVSLLIMLLLVTTNLISQVSWAGENLLEGSNLGGLLALVVLAPYGLLVFLCIKYHRLIVQKLSRVIVVFNFLFILVFLTLISPALKLLEPLSQLSKIVLGGSGMLVNSLIVNFILVVILVFYLIHNINKQGRFSTQRPTAYLLIVVVATAIHLINIYVLTGIKYDFINSGHECGPIYEIRPLLYSGEDDNCMAE